MTYVSSGKFKEDLVRIFGTLVERDEALPGEVEFEQFSTELSLELASLYALFCKFDLPRLCKLRWSYPRSIAESYDATEEELKEEYYVEEEEQIALFMKSVEIFNDQGNPFFTVCDDGVCIAYDDPWEIEVIYDDFSKFILFLVQLSAVSQGKADLSEVRETFVKEFRAFECSDGYHQFIERSIEAAS